MTTWQRRLRLGLGVFILLFAVGVFLSVRHPSRRPAPPPAIAKDPKAVAQATNGTQVQARGTRQQYKLEYEQILTFEDGSSRATKVRAYFPDRNGRDFKVTAAQGTGKTDWSQLQLHGAVEMTSSDGLRLTTEDATYSNADAVVRAPGAVSFSRNRMSGTSNGMTYNRNTETVTLLDQVVIHVAPDESGKDAAEIQTGLAEFARRDKYIRFEKGVTIVRTGETIKADGGVAYLTDDEKRVKLVALRGNARVTGNNAAAGGLKAMTARDIDLAYAENGESLQHAVLTGNSIIDLAGETAATGRRLSADWIDVNLAPDGATVTGLIARERVQLELPPENGVPARVVRSATLQATGAPPTGLTAAAFAGNVEFRETPAPPASPRVARSATMNLAMKGGFSSIDSASFAGGVRFEEGDMSASSREALYILAKGVLQLSGADGRTGQVPRVVDEQAAIEAKKIDIALEGRKITAADSVKSDLRPRKPDPKKPAGAGGAQGTRLPSLLKQDQPVSATSDALVYDSAASHAVYTGHAQLWQADTTIKGDQITLDDQKGDLSAKGHVESRMMLEQTNEKTKAKERVRSIATAREMVYEDNLRRATYTTEAKLNGPQGDLSADRIELYLRESGSEIDRLEAYNTVLLKTPEGRKATGARLTYLSADERYVMNGAPVRIEQECRETTGKTLTFFRSADRILVDGNEQKRTETKGLSACGSGPRSD